MRQPFCSERLPLILCFKSLCTTFYGDHD
jgi:hypothetical protein